MKDVLDVVEGVGMGMDKDRDTVQEDKDNACMVECLVRWKLTRVGRKEQLVGTSWTQGTTSWNQGTTSWNKGTTSWN